MAYHDENGRITIDGQAADRDIRRLREAAGILKDSRAGIRNMRRQSMDMKGLAAGAIQEKSMEMERKLSQMIDKLEETADYIQKVVIQYQKIDENLKSLIQQTMQAAQHAVQAIQNGVGEAAGTGTSSPAEGVNWEALGTLHGSFPGFKK